MNCLEVRRVFATNPNREDEDAPLLEHIAACDECARAFNDSKRFEHLLRQAVQFPVPDNLVSKVLLRQSFDAPSVQRRWPLALAASLVLAIAATVSISYFMRTGSGLDQDVVELVNGAGYALAAKGPVGHAEVEAALRPVGLSLSEQLRNVTFASRCYLRGKLAGHLVFKGARSPITVFLIPHTRIENEETISAGHLAGVLLPGRKGTIAVVGAPGESLDSVVQMVQKAVRWEA